MKNNTNTFVFVDAILRKHSLKSYNTFGIDAKADFFSRFDTIDQLIEILDTDIFKQQKRLILGGGSNILFTRNFEGLVLLNRLKGISKKQISDDEYLVTAASGEVWHHLVTFALSQNLGGVENLSLIPGRVGASPIQNIGAYGVELKDVFDHLTALDLENGNTKIFNKEECAFGYRDSYFKNSGKNKYIILEVTFKLSTKHQLNTSYGTIEQELQKLQLKPTIQNISTAVCSIRKSKLPNPQEIGNAGSFFKNPVISLNLFESLKKSYPDIPGYPTQKDNEIKTAAGYFIEKCGLKGYRDGNAGIHQKQALVLVNYGNATGNEIYDLSCKIINQVKTTFGVLLEREVNIL